MILMEIWQLKFANSAVSNELLQEIMPWKNKGASTDDKITWLRLRPVLSEYVHTIHNWIDGK